VFGAKFVGALSAAFHEAVAGEIQAKFDAAGMKTRGPIELALRKKGRATPR